MIWSLFKTITKPVLPLGKFAQSITDVIVARDNWRIRRQAFEDVQHTRATWMNMEGWSGIVHGLPAVYSLDPAGFYMLERDGEKIGSISVVTYPEIKFAYVGFYVVPKELRGNGFGKLLFDETIKYTEQQRGVATTGLNCLEDMAPLYRKWGFVTYTIDDIWRLSGPGSTKAEATPQLAEVSPTLLDKVISYDAEVFGAPRAEFLHGFINKPNTATVIVEDEDQVHGYGIISERAPAKPEPHTSYRIGPLYARNPAIATELLNRLLAAVNLMPEQNVFLETPGTNPAAAGMVTQFGFTRTASMEKMYRGEPPAHKEPQMFCYCSLATGG